MNTELRPCPKCRRPIPSEAPEGLCPECLLAAVLAPTAGGASHGENVPPAVADLARCFPHLEIVELIGQGGMGFVFKARQPKLDRFVALKILPQSLAADPAFAERFSREGRVLARLSHPNIVTIHDFGQANGFFYLLMEFVDGVNLRQAMKAGRFSPEQALAVVPRICDALQYAHSEGVLHRDIKPENILLDTKSRVKIADFGIAKLIGQSQLEAPSANDGRKTSEPGLETPLTQGSTTLGTPHYMAPEQAQEPHNVDHRADIYSLGVVFYEMLTGELPRGEFQPPSRKISLDRRLDDVVLRSLEKKRERRQQSAGEVKTQIETIAADPATAAWPSWNAGRFRVIGIAACIGFIALLVVLMSARRGFNGGRSNARVLDTGVVSPSGTLVTQPTSSRPHNPAPGQVDWVFKCFVPPQHLAMLLFVNWSNGIPKVDEGFSTYFKVSQKGGIDLDCVVSCYRIPESAYINLDDSQRSALMAAWSFPPKAGITNALRWDVCLGGKYTASRWVVMPPYHQGEKTVEVSVPTGHQRAIRLIELDDQAGREGSGWSGVELRFILQPLTSPAIRTFAKEVNHTNYVAGSGVPGKIEEMLKAIQTVPLARD